MMCTRNLFFFLSLLLATGVQGFVVRQQSLADPRIQRWHTHTKRDALLVPSVVDSMSSLTLADESWRQYVPLVVIAGVLVDILLGSPLANMALKPLRGDEMAANEIGGTDAKKVALDRSRERIDSERVAKEAIERAQNALELRKFLDESKTDWDRMEEMKRKLDSEMQDLDEDLARRSESLKKRR